MTSVRTVPNSRNATPALSATLDACTIPLTQGYVALVDPEDFEKLGHFKWRALAAPQNRTIYAIRDSLLPNGKRTTVRLHREIMGFPSLSVDHRDTDGLNCQKHNLRLATKQQNAANTTTTRANTSGFKGVKWSKPARKWAATITVNYKSIHLGLFLTPERAHIAYAEAAKAHFGEFARIV